MKRGFTLVELLIVISIIGILSGFLFINFANVRERGRDAQRKSDMQQVKSALRLFYNDFQHYPESDANTRIVGCGTASSLEVCAWGEAMEVGNTSYMQLPSDPVGENPYEYRYMLPTTENQLAPEDFYLVATLENPSDPQAVESQTRCGLSSDDYDAYGLVAGSFVVCTK